MAPVTPDITPADWLIPPAFYGAQPFSEGLAGVTDGSGRWGYIDTSGTLVIPYRYHEVGSFHGGVARVRVRRSGINPFASRYEEFHIDTRGKRLPAATVTSAPPITGPASPLTLYEQDGLYGYRSRKGAVVISPRYSSAREFSDGYAAVMHNGAWGYIGGSGFLAAPLVFELCVDASEGIAAVQLGGRWGYIRLRR